MTSNTDTDEDDDPGRTRRRWLTGIAGVLVAATAVVYWPGCRKYPPVTSREGLSLMRLLYAACNTKDPARLAKVEADADRLERAGKLSEAERAAVDRIVGLAREGEWERAEREAFRFAEDQVGVGHADPAGHDHGPPAGKGGRPR